MWSGWAGIALIAGALNLLLFISMLCSKPVRNNTFNVYLMAIMFPDIVFSVGCGITCLMNAVYGQYWSHWMCNLQQFYFVFGLGANAWMNAVIAYQLHTMLCFSSYRRRFKPPTRQRVLQHTAIVYLYVCFLGTWGLIERPWFPFHADAALGLVCMPLDQDMASSIVFWLVFLPLFMGIPISYVQWVCWDVYRRRLMPPAGKSRTLTVYFARLIISFLIMWTPNFILMYMLGQWLTPWAHWAGGTWSHLQPLISALLTLYKPDILEALVQFLTCRCAFNTVKEELGDRRNSYSRTSFFQLLRRSSASIPVLPLSSVNGNHHPGTASSNNSEFLSSGESRVTTTTTTEVEVSRNHDPSSRMSIVTIEPEDVDDDDDAEARVVGDDDDDELWPTTASTLFVTIREQQGKTTIHINNDADHDAEATRVIDAKPWPTSSSLTLFTIREPLQEETAIIEDDDDDDDAKVRVKVVDDDALWPMTSSTLFTIRELQKTTVLEDNHAEAKAVVENEPCLSAIPEAT